VRVTAGGSERAHSVLRALDSLAAEAADEDWVLVHDAARPCLTNEDIDKLVETVSDDAVGGVLGVRVLDTIKHVDASGRVDSTVPRDGLWRAFTPQMFRLGPLRRALADAVDEGILVTDEASAMELGGCRPRMVEGRPDNIKVTRPADLPLAAFYLRQQEGAC
jgi:2-C-methyl-D-erythritol 4-phosphate cytidylyltransferase